jgi:hypothetical protein
MKFKINKKIILLYLIIFILIKNKFKDNYFIKNENNNSAYVIYKYFINNNDSIYFNITDINYYFSIKYNILIFDINNNFILPSDLTLFNQLHLICIITIKNQNVEINSLPNIYQNKYYECIEFININEKIKFGIKIYQKQENYENIKAFQTFFFLEKNFEYNQLNCNNIFFDSLLINKKYLKNVYNLNKNEALRLKKSYIKFPINCLKREIAIYENKWYFQNIYNNYFCFCKGFFCKMNKNHQNCKYHIFLNIIDKNRKVYKKEDFFLLDFVFNEYSSDDVYPIFKQMLIQNQPVHYFTEKIDIYNEYCYKKFKCFDIIYANKNNYTINGNFLEKYLTLILKLKQVISGGGINIFYKENLFYDIEYITYICVGHGVSYFKHFLYNSYNWYGSRIYDKILLPPSDILISPAKMYGWKEENIIKINLPRWDKYNFNDFYQNNSNINNNSIFFMFTWRKIKKDKNISIHYFKNIFNLINNEELYFYLKRNKIILYFSLHHKLNKYIYKFKNNKFFYFIKEDSISECLSKINLIISDFSSIIFDAIYRRKPFIIYIPDAYDTEIKNIYERTYYEVIESLKNGTIYFENKYFGIEEVVNKIKYYIDNNFKLELQLEKFYDRFQLRKGNNTNEFIKYITSII